MIHSTMRNPGLREDSRLLPNGGDTQAPEIYVADGNLGKGLFAGTFIKRGTSIYKFRGPIIGFKEAVDKGEKQCYPLQVSKHEYVDIESPGCFANHSCQPNAGIRNDLELVAISDIEPGQEIRYDYSTTMDEDYFTMSCRCGTPQCRKVVTDFKLLPDTVKQKYLSAGIVMRFIASQYLDK